MRIWSDLRSATELRRWLGRVDPVPPVVGAVALIVFTQHGFDGYLSRDLAIYSYGGQQVANGVPPYLGILNRAGPLAHLIPAIGVVGARIGGFDELLGMRLLFLIIAVACVCLVYLLGRDLFASRLAGLAAAAAFLTFSGFIEYASNGPREKTAMVLFLLCTLVAVTKQRWVAAGLSLSLATLVLQLAFPVGLAAMLVALVGVRPGERIRALIRFAVGGLVPTSICVLYFVAAGALEESIDAFLLINARYSLAVPLTSDLTGNWSALQNGYGASLWVMVVGLAVLLILSLPALRRENRRRDPAVVAVSAVGAAGIVALGWTFRDFDDWPDAFLVLPMAAIGIGGITKVVTERLAPRVALSVTLIWVAAAMTAAVSFSVTDRDHRLTSQRRSVAVMLEQLPSDSTFLSINSPQALVLSGKTNPTRHQTFTSGMDRYLDDIYPGGLRGFGERIGLEEPTMITLKGEVRPWFAETLESEYRRVGSAPGWVWYAHRSLGPDVLSAMQSHRAHRKSR